MVPVYVKGGMWTNVEDEILKAAIAKYGLNQWSRVSSLLTRKNAKQCKLRWQEWLDPRIKKSDWSPEEDRKLLNLAKLRPNQWSSISLMLKRTANQCIERYQELLVDFTGTDDVSGDDRTGAGTRLLLTGNVESTGARNTAGSSLGGLNLNPESKPARADLDEMDEDEKEMISEARARLTNTQGKKAKRKARERMLEESRRVAELLRRRELKQVGINATLKNRKKYKEQMDYNADIAFERRPDEGRFNTTDELKSNLHEKYLYDKNTQVKGTFNQEVEIQKRKEKKRREQNKKLAERKSDNLTFSQHGSNADEEDEDDDRNYKDEFLKRKKMKFSFTDKNFSGDLDVLIGETVDDIVQTNTEKSILFSGRRTSVKQLDDEYRSGEKRPSRFEDKNEKKKKREERKKVTELLNSLPDAQDDFELDIDELLDPEKETRRTTDYSDLFGADSKVKLPKVIVDKTEQRRLEKKRIKELKEQLDYHEMPQVLRRKLPIPHISVKFDDYKNEIEAEMGRLIRFKASSDESYANVADLENTLLVWSVVKERVEEETDRMLKTGKYDKLKNLEKTSFPSEKNLLCIIKRYTERSNEIEEGLVALYNKQKLENGSISVMEEISELKDKIQEVDDEMWAYSQFEDMELESIKLRKGRMQKELDEINLLIDKKRQELLSR